MKTDYDLEAIESELRLNLEVAIYTALDTAADRIGQHETETSQPDSGQFDRLGYVKRMALECLESDELDHMLALEKIIQDKIANLRENEKGIPAKRESRDELLRNLRSS
jgi:hypothetical protein